MTVTLSEDEKRKRLSTMLSLFPTAMLVTHAGDGTMRARPLSIAESQDDGAMYFSTAVDSPKVEELEADPHVNVVMQDGRRFVSLTGTATVVRDRLVIERLWRPGWKVWFPLGKDDPSLCLLRVDPTEATYWDLAGTTGIRYAFEIAKAYVKGGRPPSDGDERHTAHVKL